MFTTLFGFLRRKPIVASTAAFALVGVSLIACNRDRVAPTTTGRSTGITRNQLAGRSSMSFDRRHPGEDQFVRLANEIPGFAGFVLSPTHEVVAFVKDTTATKSGIGFAKAALQAHLSSDAFGIRGASRPTTVRVVPADYDFATLAPWRNFISDSILGAITGVVTVDFDESTNRIEIGLLASVAGAQNQVQQILTSHGVPLGAVHFTNGGALRPSRGMSSTRRRTFNDLGDASPDFLVGGIKFEDVSTPTPCSVGVVVDSASARRFVSASHCTNLMYNLSGDSVGTFGGAYIGHETADPPGAPVVAHFSAGSIAHRTPPSFPTQVDMRTRKA